MTESSEFLSWARQRMAALLGFGMTHNGTRDYWGMFGYPNTLTPQDLWKMYQRHGVASRVVRAFPQATWEEQPTVRDEKGNSAEETTRGGAPNDSYSPFVKSVNDFFQRTQALRYLERADRLSSVGHFGILVMGFKDGSPLSQPLGGGKRLLAYLAAYGEPAVAIVNYENDTSNERFGLPTLYRVNMGNETKTANAPAPKSFDVHWSRVIHIAEFLEDSPVLAMPRLEPIYNHLLDLSKVVGSSAEAFYRNSNPGIAFTADSDAKISEEALTDMKTQAEEFDNQFRRILALQGVTPHTLGPANQTADPANNIEKLLDLIAGATGIPKRILVGSERGELASSQDADNWASRIDERQNNFAGPSILLPFVNKMVETGNIDRPQGVVTIEWPESNALSPKDQAEVGRIKSESLAKYAASPNAEMIVPPQEFRVEILGLEPESEYELPEEEELPEDVDVDGNPLPDDEVDNSDPITEEDDEVPAINRYGAGRARRLIANAKPRTLYVRRDLLNADEVRDHYKALGLDTLTSADDMHVTIAFSRYPVDWMKVGSDWTSDPKGRLIIAPGGARMHEAFGPQKDVLALLFTCSPLSWRHEDIKNAGASWDWPEYQPHISITYAWGGTSVQQRTDAAIALEPYRGELIFGPEVFEEVKEDWKATIKENERA